MDIQLDVPKHKQFRAFYMFFVIISMQSGVEMIGTPRIIFEKAGHDAWISILLAYLFLLVLALVMIYILEQYGNTDILGIQTDIFGSFISKVIGTCYIIYFAVEILTNIIMYIEIINVFIFPMANTFVITAMLLIIIIYSSFGGLRTIIGVVFLFMILSFWIVFLLPKPISMMEFMNFLPVMDRDIIDIIKGSKAASYTFFGLESLFFLYPFIRNKEKIRLPVILGVSWAAFIVLSLTIISIGYFSAEQLGRRIWPVLHLFKIQTSPFIERLDYIVVAEWMMVTTPKMIILMWGITYAAKRMYKIPKKYSLYVTSILILISISFFKSHYQTQNWIDGIRVTAEWLIYVYPFILLPLVVIKKKSRKKKKGSTHHANN